MSSAVPIGVAVVGLGAVGRAAAAMVAADNGMRLLAAVDVVGSKLDAVRDLLPPDTLLTSDLEEIEAADVAIITANPHFDRIAPTLRQLMFKKTHAVSDCAEMTWPWLKHPHLSDVLANDAQRAGVAIVATGTFPGVFSASLPLLLASTISDVRSIRVHRTVDLNTCRSTIRRRAGLDLTTKQFRPLAAEGKIGLPGLAESVVLIAQGLDRHPMQADIRRVIRPTLAPGANGEASPGRVTGVEQLSGYSADDLDIELSLTLTSGAAVTPDVIEIVGDRTIRIELPAVTEAGTAAVLVNTARLMPRLAPGLRTALDLPIVGRR